MLSLLFFRSREEHFGLGLKDLETERSCMQIVKWHILKHSMDSQMQILYQVKLQKEKQGKIGKGRKFHSATPCLQIEDLCNEVKFLRSFHGQQD